MGDSCSAQSFNEDMFIKTLLYGNSLSDKSDSQRVLETLMRCSRLKKNLKRAFYSLLYHLYVIVCNNMKNQTGIILIFSCFLFFFLHLLLAFLLVSIGKVLSWCLLYCFFIISFLNVYILCKMV